jgi:phosphate transport system substrate-binding protein
MVNKAGQALSPSIDTFKAAAARADWVGARSQAFNMVLVDQPGAQAWPITGATWAIVYKKPADTAAVADALKFFKWSYEKGGAMASSLDYVPLPDNAVKAIEASWKDIQGSGM